MKMRFWVMLTRFSTLRVSVLVDNVSAAQCAEECPVSVVYLHWRLDPAWAPATLPPSRRHVTRHTWHVTHTSCDVMFVTRKWWSLFHSSSLWNNDGDGSELLCCQWTCHMSECMEHVCISCYQLLILLWLLPSVTQRRGCNEITTATLPHSLNIHSFPTQHESFTHCSRGS